MEDAGFRGRPRSVRGLRACRVVMCRRLLRSACDLWRLRIRDGKELELLGCPLRVSC